MKVPAKSMKRHNHVTDHVTFKTIIENNNSYCFKPNLYCLTTKRKKESALGAIAILQLVKRTKTFENRTKNQLF